MRRENVVISVVIKSELLDADTICRCRKHYVAKPPNANKTRNEIEQMTRLYEIGEMRMNTYMAQRKQMIKTPCRTLPNGISQQKKAQKGTGTPASTMMRFVLIPQNA
jgi:hypothetical protein